MAGGINVGFQFLLPSAQRRQRRKEWDEIVQRNPDLAKSPDEYNQGMDTYVQTGKLPTEYAVNDGEGKTESRPVGKKTDVVSFPTTEVSPDGSRQDFRPIKLHKESMAKFVSQGPNGLKDEGFVPLDETAGDRLTMLTPFKDENAPQPVYTYDKRKGAYFDSEGRQVSRVPKNAEIRDVSDPSDDRPKPPPGYRFKPDGTLEAIPGGPAYVKAEDSSNKRKQAAKNVVDKTDLLIGQVDAAIKAVSGWSAGAGSTMKGIPATSAKNLDAKLKSIQANVAFQALQAMREASKTGGALGAVSERELELLSSTIASIDQGQSADQLIENLKQIKNEFGRFKTIAQTDMGGGQEGDKFGYVVGQTYTMKDGNTATYLGNGEFE